jgi:hypothetical protein
MQYRMKGLPGHSLAAGLQSHDDCERIRFLQPVGCFTLYESAFIATKVLNAVLCEYNCFSEVSHPLLTHPAIVGQ